MGNWFCSVSFTNLRTFDESYHFILLEKSKEGEGEEGALGERRIRQEGCVCSENWKKKRAYTSYFFSFIFFKRRKQFFLAF